MQIRYRNTLAQLLALQKVVLRHTEFGRKLMLHRFIAVEVIVVFITILFAINHNRFKVFAVFIIVTGLAWLFRERAVLLQFRKDFKRELHKDDAGLFAKDRVLRIAPKDLTVTVGNQQMRYTWDQLEKTDRDGQNVYILLKGMLHYVIPLAAFTDEHEVAAFLDAIASYRL